MNPIGSRPSAYPATIPTFAGATASKSIRFGCDGKVHDHGDSYETKDQKKTDAPKQPGKFKQILSATMKPKPLIKLALAGGLAALQLSPVGAGAVFAAGLATAALGGFGAIALPLATAVAVGGFAIWAVIDIKKTLRNNKEASGSDDTANQEAAHEPPAAAPDQAEAPLEKTGNADQPKTDETEAPAKDNAAHLPAAAEKAQNPTQSASVTAKVFQLREILANKLTSSGNTNELTNKDVIEAMKSTGIVTPDLQVRAISQVSLDVQQMGELFNYLLNRNNKDA